MNTYVKILIVGDNEILISKLKKALNHPQIVIDFASRVPEDQSYHFYILGGSIDIEEAAETIRKCSEGSPMYLYGSVCEKSVPVQKLLKCNIVACIECGTSMQSLINDVQYFRKRRAIIHEASCKLDYLKAGDLKTLTRKMKKTELDRFVDYIQNHPLPMILVSCENEILHANTAMEQMIGICLTGIPAYTFWSDRKQFDEVVNELMKEGQLLGREVTLKNSNYDLITMKLYTSLHCDKAGNWLNTRCLFVPTE